jgi:putative lipoprotein
MKTFSCFYLALALGSVGCAGTAPTPQNGGVKGGDAGNVIEGTAAYRERIAMPSNAEFEAVLQDVSRADAPAMEIARTTIPGAPSPPIRFTIPYDAAKIDSRLSYTVRAAIRVDGKLWFASDTAYPVLTRGAGKTVDMLLKRVAEPSAEDARLMDTAWRILSLAGEPVSATEGKREPQLMLKSANGRDSWSATVGCNQMSGGVAVNGNSIAFKPGMSTLMACPPPLDVIEKQLGRSLMVSTQWRIQGNRLELRDDAGVQTFLCEAILPR